MLLLEKRNVDFFYLKIKKEVKNPLFHLTKQVQKFIRTMKVRKYIKIYVSSAQSVHFLLNE